MKNGAAKYCGSAGPMSRRRARSSGVSARRLGGNTDGGRMVLHSGSVAALALAATGTAKEMNAARRTSLRITRPSGWTLRESAQRATRLSNRYGAASAETLGRKWGFALRTLSAESLSSMLRNGPSIRVRPQARIQVESHERADP